VQTKNLFKYLKLLTQKQKKFFRLHYSVSDLDKKKDMIALFDALNSAKKFNNGKLLKKFKNKDLGRLSRRLYEVIEDFILFFDKQKDQYDKIQELIAKSKRQFSFGFSDRALIHITNAESICNDLHNKELLIQILKEKKRYLIALSDYNKLKDISKKIDQTFESNYKDLTESIKISKLLVLLQNQRLKNNKDDKKIKLEKEDERLLKMDERSLSTKNQIDLLEVKSLYYLIKNEFKTSLKLRLKQVSVYKKQSEGSQQIRNLSESLHNVFQMQMKLSKLSDAKKTLAEIKAIGNRKQLFANPFTYSQYLIRMHNCELYYNYICKDFKAIKKLENTVNKTIEQYSENVLPREIFTLRYFIGIANFVLKKYAVSENCFFNLSVQPELSSKPKIEGASKLLYLICIYESKNESLLNSTFLSTKRFIEKKYSLSYEVDKMLISIISTLMRNTLQKKERIDLFKSFIARFKKLGALSKSEKERMEDLKILEWLGSKV